MSQHQNAHDHDDIPRFDAWFGVMVSSLVPVILALFAQSFAIPLIACTVLLFVTGLVLLSVQSRRKAAERARPEPSAPRQDSRTAQEQLAVEAE